MPVDGLSAAGLVLAVPGVVDLFCKYGDWIVDRVKTIKHAKEVWTNLGEFGHNLASGTLKLQIKRAREYYTTNGSDPEIKKSLELQIARLGKEVNRAKEFLEEHKPDTLLGRGMLAIRSERVAKGINKNLRTRQTELAELISMLGEENKQILEKVILSRKRFMHDTSEGYQPVPFTANIFTAKGEYKPDETDDEYSQVSVIVERYESQGNSTYEVLHRIASLLHYGVTEASPRKGILPCLGFRMDPTPELVFQLPDKVEEPQTLQTVIAADVGKPFGGNHPLDYRFRLARRLSEAVLGVHSAGLVHKNIRSETVILIMPKFEGADEDAKHKIGFGDPYLMSWYHGRAIIGNMSNKAGTAEWTENIYRHPERQGVEIQNKIVVQERSNIGHDIYSLGVCLLEIGLWDPLVRTRTANGMPQVADYFRVIAKVENEADPDAALAKTLKIPTRVKEILLELARKELPQRIGLGYTRLVVACLTGLDRPSGFGSSVDFEGYNWAEKGLAFQELVLGFFADMSL